MVAVPIPKLAIFDARLGRFEVEVFIDFSLDEGGDRNESNEKEEESNLHLDRESLILRKNFDVEGVNSTCEL